MEAGISEQIEFIDSNATDITSDFGVFGAATFIIDESSRAERGVTTKGKPAEIMDGSVENRATLTCKPTSLEILKIMGSFDGTAGTVTFTENLPEHDTLRGQYTSGEYFEFNNFKVGGFTLESSLDESVRIVFDPVHAKTGSIPQGTVTEYDPDVTPLNWTDTVVKIDGTQFGVTESVAGDTLDRNISPEHGLGQGREPAEVIEGNYNITPSFVVKVQDAEPWEKLLDDTTYPLTVQDERSPVNEISFDFGDGGELVIEKGKFEIDTFDMAEDKETRTIELSINAENIKVRGL